jgi:arylsulfatase
MSPSTRRILWFACAAAVAGPVARTPAAPDRPNVLFILADDMGFSDAGCYGGEIATPSLDRLAKNGLRFTQFYNTARCWPSRAALLTGFYAQQVRRDALPGAPGGGQGIRPAWAPLLPKLLKPLGYRSYHSGKWHIDGEPLKNGFERSYRVTGAENNHFMASGVLEDGVPLADTNGYYVTAGIADHAVRCLKEHAEKHPGVPFFEYLAFISPHFPLHAPAEDIARYRDVYPAGWDAVREARFGRMKDMGLVRCGLSPIQRDVGPPYDFPDAFEKLGAGEVNRPLPWPDLTSEQRAFQATKMSIHAAMIDRMDREIGRVLDQLRAMGAWTNTLIFFASDNGASAEIMVRGGGHDPKAPPGSAATYLCLGPGFSGAANTPLRRHKTWLHEGGISTPLIVHWPAGIAARGELRHTPAHLVDIVPTVLELAGGKSPAEWGGKPVPPPPGRSLVPVLARDVPGLHDELWWCHEGHRALRDRDWKIVALKDGAWELYNLADDRAEAANLAGEHPDRVREMAARWDALAAVCREQALKDAPPTQAKKPRGKNAVAK